jgi:hypothetical protein
MNRFYIALYFLSIAFPKLYAQHGAERVSQQAQKSWINNMLHNHSVIQRDSIIVVEPVIQVLEDYTICSFRLFESSRIFFKDKTWADIYIHSSHSDPAIGDICFLISSTKKKYLNLGHICGGTIQLESSLAKVPENLKDFVKRFVSDTDKSPWTKF